MRTVSEKKSEWFDFVFEGLDWEQKSNNYITTQRRVSEDGEKVVVKYNPVHIKKTKYGYAVIEDYNHVIFVKDWQVNENYFGVEVVFTKKYTKAKEWGEWDDFGEETDYDVMNNEELWDHLVEWATEQQEADNKVSWEF